MHASRSEHIGQQLARTVGHQMVVRELAGRVDEAGQLDYPFHLTQVADRSVQGAKQLDCDAACGLPSLRCGHILAQLSYPRRAVLASEVPRDEHEVIAPDKWHIGSCRRGWRGQGNAQLSELVVNSHVESPGFRDEVSLRE